LLGLSIKWEIRHMGPKIMLKFASLKHRKTELKEITDNWASSQKNITLYPIPGGPKLCVIAVSQRPHATWDSALNGKFR
jgi:hypothetical protein